MKHSIPSYCNIANEMKGTGIKINTSEYVKSQSSFMPPELPNLITILTAVKIPSQVEKAKCVLWFHESRSVVTMQRRFRMVFGMEPPTENAISQVI
jgi:hypothetical protein